MAANIVVNTTDLTVIADDGLCTLSEAVDAANLNISSGLTTGECVAGDPYPTVDDITFDLGIFPGYFFPFAPFELTEPMRILGPGADVMSLSSIANSRVFIVQNIQTNTYFEISGMTFEFNHLPKSFGQYGGAILVTLFGNSELVMDQLRFYQNSAEQGGGAIGLYGGNDNTIRIQNSTFEGNNTTDYDTSTPIGGGAIFIGADQNVIIENSSFYDNFNAHSPLVQPQSDAAGGAILVRSNQTLPSTV
ncbi:MAG: CSLREA domain-containing protein, partial [Proteobacteria bacterium]|nr:CSLREA domain-containing protein [Pseudomonadota bacterium]